MRVLPDTHILLWALSDNPKLSPKARKLIENAAEIYVSEPMRLITADPQLAQYTSLAILV